MPEFIIVTNDDEVAFKLAVNNACLVGYSLVNATVIIGQQGIPVFYAFLTTTE